MPKDIHPAAKRQRGESQERGAMKQFFLFLIFEKKKILWEKGDDKHGDNHPITIAKHKADKRAKDSYGWEVKIFGKDTKGVLEQLEQINNLLKETYC
jgi:hypothetical protein